MPSALDLDLWIYDEDLNLVTGSGRVGFGRDEAASFGPAKSGKYYIRVYPFAGWTISEPYVLTASQGG